ncbi:MAG: hypothetical protein IPM82_29950 [Saprospiraceae bacterium]|nr:hypothetical protein [Saprospiraceae bacterium]
MVGRHTAAAEQALVTAHIVALTGPYLPTTGRHRIAGDSTAVAPTLFLPTRYLTYTYPVFFSILLVRLLGIYAAFFQKWWATAILLAALILPRFWRFEPKNHAQQDYGNYSLLFKIVDELPPDHGFIAGPPDPCNMIPMRCKRSVLFSQEGFHALYFRNYWEKMAPRLFGYIDATTTADPAVERLSYKNGASATYWWIGSWLNRDGSLHFLNHSKATWWNG